MRFAAMAAVVCVAAPLSAATVELGPPPGAVLSREKLSAIDDFINGEIASGKIPGAIVLIQRHGQQVYFKTFGKRDVEKGTPMTVDAISDPFGHQDHHQRSGDDAGRSGQNRAR